MLDHFKTPVAFYANGIGDTILALPAFRALARMFGSRLTLVCDDKLPDVLLAELRRHPLVRTPMRRNVPDWTREFDVRAVARQVGSCDFFISMVPWHSQSLQRLLDALAPQDSIGYSTRFRRLVPLDFGKHACDLSFDLPVHLDRRLRLEDYSAPIMLRARSRRLAGRIRSDNQGVRILTVHADTGTNKMWAADRFIAVLNGFLDQHPEFIVLLIGGIRQPLDQGPWSDRIIACYGIPFESALGLVETADIFLGVDSCMLHAADFFRVPSIGLFGASNPAEFGFRLTPSAVTCRASTMDGIAVHTVADALEQLAARPEPRV